MGLAFNFSETILIARTKSADFFVRFRRSDHIESCILPRRPETSSLLLSYIPYHNPRKPASVIHPGIRDFIIRVVHRVRMSGANGSCNPSSERHKRRQAYHCWACSLHHLAWFTICSYKSSGSFLTKLMAIGLIFAACSEGKDRRI